MSSNPRTVRFARGLRRVSGPLLLALCNTSQAQPALPAAPATATDPYAVLRPIEPLVWRDAWQARRELDSMAGDSSDWSAQTRAVYHLLRARALQYLNDPEAFSAAVEAGLAASAEAADNMDAGLQLQLRVLNGVRATRSGDFRAAQERLRVAVSAARRAGRGDIAALGAAELGFALTLAGEHEAALAELQPAYREAVELRDDFLIAYLNETFGTLYTYIDDYPSALRHYRQALRDYRKLGYGVYEAEAIYGIAVAQREAGAFEAALSNFRRYGQITGQHGDVHGEFDAAYGLASTYGDMGDCTRALPTIDSALSLSGPEDYKAELYKHAAICHGRAGDLRAARGALQKATDIIQAIPELAGTRWEIDLLRAEAEMLAALGEHADAFGVLRRYHEERTALLESNVSERRVRQREALENIRQSLQIELLQEQARVRELELQRQNQDLRSQRVASLFAGFAVLVSGVIVIWRLRDLRRLRSLSSSDPLTGVANRRHIFERLGRLLRRERAERIQLSLILLDIDDFKAINDRYGHPVGDTALQSVTHALREALRPGDEVARVGGEEFLVVLPRTATAEACEVAQRVLCRIRELEIDAAQMGLQITASLGVASYGVHGDDVDSLYSAADSAMYVAKRKGKNRCEVAQEVHKPSSQRQS